LAPIIGTFITLLLVTSTQRAFWSRLLIALAVCIPVFLVVGIVFAAAERLWRGGNHEDSA
jgi:hypothetical protein